MCFSSHVIFRLLGSPFPPIGVKNGLAKAIVGLIHSFWALSALKIIQSPLYSFSLCACSCLAYYCFGDFSLYLVRGCTFDITMTMLCVLMHVGVQ